MRKNICERVDGVDTRMDSGWGVFKPILFAKTYGSSNGDQ